MKSKVISALVISAALMLIATGCLSGPSVWKGPSGGLRVGFYGDSMTQKAETGGGADQGPSAPHMLTDAMIAAGFQSTYSALLGAKSPDLTAITYPTGTPGPQVVVIALGTNDLHDGYANPQTLISNIVAFINRIKPECAIIVNVEAIPVWGLSTYAPPYNQLLDKLAASRPDIAIADWNSEVQANPSYLGVDNVHEVGDGLAAYRDLFVNSVIAHEPVNGVCS